MLAALESDSWGLRENALRLAERQLAAAPNPQQTHPALLAQLLAAGSDPAPRVRMQAFLSAGALFDRLGEDGRVAIAGEAALALRRDANDPWIRLAVLALAARSPLPVLGRYVARPKPLEAGEGTEEALLGLGRLAGERAQAAELGTTVAVANMLHHQLDEALAAPLLSGLAEGLAAAPALGHALPKYFAMTDAGLEALRGADAQAVALPAWRASRLLGWSPAPRDLERARAGAARAADRSQLVADRIAALRWLDAFGGDALAEHRLLLLDLLDARVPAELQQAALERIVRSSDQAVGRELIARWRTLGPTVRQRAADFLVYRPFNHDALLDALESGGLEIGQLNLHLERRRALLRARDPETRRRAAAFLSDLEVLTRADAVAAMRPALALPGDADRGREVFRELCARCHRIREADSGPDAVVGMEIGPSLTDIFRRSRESLLVDIVDPNAAVDPSYLVFDVTTLGGETTSGLLLAQDENGVTLRNADGADVRIAVEQIDEVSASGLSLMPEELESGLDVARLADLLAYLSQPR